MKISNERVEDYQVQVETTALAMRRLAKTFRATFRVPCPLYLSVHKIRRAIYLRWRKSGVKGNQPYVQLDSSMGKKILLTLPSAFRQVYIKYHQQVIELNHQHALLLAEQKRLEHYLQQAEALERLKGILEVN